MARVDLPYLNVYQSRRRKYGYYRRDGFRLRIQGDPGTPEFLAAYQAIHRRFEMRTSLPGILPGSLAELIVRYKASPEWKQLKDSSRKDYQKSLDRLTDDFGNEMVVNCDRAAVRLIRDRYATRPGKGPGDPAIPSPRMANKTVTMLSILMTYAVEVGQRRDNPALRPRRLRTGPGYRAWLPEEIHAFLTSAPDFRLPLLLALATGQRAIDQVAMTWRAFDGEAIEVVQEKTGKLVWIPCHPELKAALVATERTSVNILTRADGTPWENVQQFQTAVSRAVRSAKLTGVTWHGLRATASSWLAELGCSEREIMAITGHVTAASVASYAQHADQKMRARSAITKLSGRRLERQKNEE